MTHPPDPRAARVLRWCSNALAGLVCLATIVLVVAAHWLDP